MNPLKKYIWLVDTVMRAGNKGLTLQQIADAYYYNDDINGGKLYSDRTFHRHRNEVKEIFGIEIECYPTGSVFRYRIVDSGDNDYFRRWLLDSIAVNRVVSDSKDRAQYISIENTHTEHLTAVLQALKERRKVEFDYMPYWSETSTHYFDFQIHAIKMFERRWYIIGRYKNDMPYIILALDRISQFEIQEETFQRDSDFSLEELFDGAFGITIGDGDVENVWLKVEEHQAKYLRSLPLHRSQVELTCRDEGYALFALRVRPSYELRQRILSLGSSVEVMQPESLRNEIREEAKAMLAKYKEDDE
ncbi:MAG: WYL domain-containing protein [Bacteroidales bacterium]|nr:WYL domain-containing protein [Bacteroidales bacterium]